MIKNSIFFFGVLSDNLTHIFFILFSTTNLGSHKDKEKSVRRLIKLREMLMKREA